MLGTKAPAAIILTVPVAGRSIWISTTSPSMISVSSLWLKTNHCLSKSKFSHKTLVSVDTSPRQDACIWVTHFGLFETRSLLSWKRNVSRLEVLSALPTQRVNQVCRLRGEQ